MKYKYITHEVMNDSPFIGALIVANGCNRNCKGCFNQELIIMKSKENSAREIVDIVKSNKLNQGIILGGLEWTEQPENMLSLITWAIRENLKVIIYTSLTEEQFKRIPNVENRLFHGGFYVKYGAYDVTNVTNDNVHYGVKLASSNQHIVYYSK